MRPVGIIIDQVPGGGGGGVSLAEKVTNCHVHSKLVHMPLSMELKVWLVIGGGCSQGGDKAALIWQKEASDKSDI